MTLKIAISEFLLHCQFEKNLSSKTLKAYETDLWQLKAFLENKEQIVDISKEDLRNYLVSLSSLKPKSIKRKIAVIKTLFNYLEFEDKIVANPLRKMRIKIKEPHKLPTVMNLREVILIFKSSYHRKDQIKKEASYAYLESIRNIVILELLFSTGARVSEVANLHENCIDLHSGNIIIKGKGNKERIIQICNKESLAILKTYYTLFKSKIEKAGGAFLVNRFNKKLSDQSIRNTVRTIASKAGITKHITPHIFRHSFATLLLEKDVDIKYIQAMLGHSSIITTQIYTHVNRARQRHILKTKHPRKEFSMFMLPTAIE
jgi:integrase/recombinase XerD